MAINLLRIYALVDQRRFVTSFTNGGGAILPPFIENDFQPIEVILMKADPSGGLSRPFKEVSNQGMLLRVGIGNPGPTTSTISAFVALQATTTATPDWNPTAATGTSWVGILDLTTIYTLLGTANSTTATFELEIRTTTDGSALGTVTEEVTIQQTCNLLSDMLKQAGTISVLPSPTFYSAQETGTLFLRKNAVDTVYSTTRYEVVSGGSLSVKSVTPSGTLAFSFDDHSLWGVARRVDIMSTVSTGTATGTLYHLAPGFPGSSISPYADQTYVNARVASPGTLTGPLYLSHDPIANNEAATKAYVLANSGTNIGNGLIRTAGVLQVDFGSTGSQVPRGDHTHSTGTIPESGSNFYFTEARVRATPATGIDTTTLGVVGSGDTFLTALGKLEATKVSTSSGSFSAPAFFQPGSAAAPGLAVSLDADTGVFSPGSNQLAFTIAGAEIARFLNNAFSVGLASAIAKIGAQGAGTDIILALKLGATQSVDAMQILDSSGAVLLSVNKDGGLEINNTGIASTEPRGLQISASDATGNANIRLLNNTGQLGLIRLDPASASSTSEMWVISPANLRLYSGGALAGASMVIGSDGLITCLTGANRTINTSLIGLIFAAKSTASVSNSVIETTVVPPTGLGPNVFVRADFTEVGRTVEFKMRGLLNTAASPGNLTINFYLGSTLLATTGAVSVAPSLNQRNYWLDLQTTGRGSNDVITNSPGFCYSNGTNVVCHAISTGTATTVLADSIFGSDVKVQWSSASASNIITQTQYSASVLGPHR